MRGVDSAAAGTASRVASFTSVSSSIEWVYDATYVLGMA